MPEQIGRSSRVMSAGALGRRSADDLARFVRTVVPSIAVGLRDDDVGTEHPLLTVLAHDCPGQALLTSHDVHPTALPGHP